MSTYDVTPDEEPLDLAAVAADDAMLEQLRRALSPDAAVIWDDDDDLDDPAFALLHGLQRDVAADLPSFSVLPAGVVPLTARRRGLGRGATVAAVAAGLLSLGGVAAAAASTPGQPLYGVRSAVSSAVTTVVDAITPAPTDQAGRLHGAASPTTKPSSSASARSAEVRSTNSAAATKQALDKAETFLGRGQYTAANEQLNRAARALAGVTDASTHASLAARLDALRARLVVAHPTPSADDRSGKGNDGSGGSDGKGDNANGTKVDNGNETKVDNGKGNDGTTGDGKSVDGNSDSGKDDSKTSGSGSSHRESATPRPSRSSGRSGGSNPDAIRSPADLVGGGSKSHGPSKG